MPTKFYSITETAQQLGLGRVRVWQLIKEGKLPAQRIGHTSGPSATRRSRHSSAVIASGACAGSVGNTLDRHGTLNECRVIEPLSQGDNRLQRIHIRGWAVVWGCPANPMLLRAEAMCEGPYAVEREAL